MTRWRKLGQDEPLHNFGGYRAVYPAPGVTQGPYWIRGFVDGQPVVREWWYGKQRWEYSVASLELLRLWHADGRLQVCRERGRRAGRGGIRRESDGCPLCART